MKIKKSIKFFLNSIAPKLTKYLVVFLRNIRNKYLVTINEYFHFNLSEKLKERQL